MGNSFDILHIEDNLSDAHLMQKYLKQENSTHNNYKITHSQTLTNALDILNKKNNFSVILLDLNLPDGNGLYNIETIKKINSLIPIIVITSLTGENIAEDALRLGAQEFISKSYGNSRIIQRVIQSSIFRKKAEMDLARKAYYDDLTGLPNRMFFENAALTMIRHAKRWERRDALMFIDLNKFKPINDTYGHEAGNIVLKEVASRLKNTLRSSDLIARYAGDEFVVYMDCGKAPVTEDLVALVADKINHAMKQPINVGEAVIEVSLSIGAAIYPDAGATFDLLLKNADVAMYEAKSNPDVSFHIIGGSKNDVILQEKKVSILPDLPAPHALTDNKILIIDDSEEDRFLYKKHLKESDFNYSFLEAENIRDAFKILENNNPVCILLDQNLPGGNGVEFLKKYQNLSQDKNAPVIMITSQEDRKLVVTAMRQGAKDYIVKGEVHQERFLHTVNTLVEQKKLQDEVKKYQKDLERSNKDLSDFSHTVAHDLKAPMRKIIMFCDLLNEEDKIIDDDNLKAYVERMKISSERMQTLIETLLTYAEISQSKEQKQDVCLHELTTEIKDDLDVWLQDHKADLVIDGLPEWPVYRSLFRQLLSNLITNGVKYADDDRRPTVNVNAEIIDDNCVITIHDNGRGIPYKYQDKIFKPFQRLQGADEIEGTGLGLSICTKIVQKHNGSVAVESVEGIGSKFIITLPQ